MLEIIRKTFGGLELSYLIRQYIFSVIIAVIVYKLVKLAGPHSLASLISLVLNTLLYPYARFIYEITMDYILGDNVFALPSGIFLLGKFITMLLCWSFAIVIAPVGLLFLYFYRSKEEKDFSEEKENNLK